MKLLYLNLVLLITLLAPCVLQAQQTNHPVPKPTSNPQNVSKLEKPQNISLFNVGDTYGYYIGAQQSYSEIEENTGSMTGVEIGLVTDRSYGVGLSYQTLTNSVEVPTNLGNVNFSYGGLFFLLSHNRKNILHLYSKFLFGLGSIALKDKTKDGLALDTKNKKSYLAYVVEPEIGLELNVLPVLKFAAGIGYRWVATDNPLVQGKNATGPTFLWGIKLETY